MHVNTAYYTVANRAAAHCLSEWGKIGQECCGSR